MEMLLHQAAGNLAGVPVEVDQVLPDPERYHRPDSAAARAECDELLVHYGLTAGRPGIFPHGNVVNREQR